MMTQGLLVVLTAANLGLLCYQSLRSDSSAGITGAVPEVIRGRALEIVDDRGKVRASISVLPEDPRVTWNGKPYPEVVLLRLMSPEGRPNVKLEASRLGSGLLVGGESDPTHVQVKAEGGQSAVKLINEGA